MTIWEARSLLCLPSAPYFVSRSRRRSSQAQRLCRALHLADARSQFQNLHASSSKSKISKFVRGRFMGTMISSWMKRCMRVRPLSSFGLGKRETGDKEQRQERERYLPFTLLRIVMRSSPPSVLFAPLTPPTATNPNRRSLRRPDARGLIKGIVRLDPLTRSVECLSPLLDWKNLGVGYPKSRQLALRRAYPGAFYGEGQATPGAIGTLTEEMQSFATSDYRGSNQGYNQTGAGGTYGNQGGIGGVNWPSQGDEDDGYPFVLPERKRHDAERDEVYLTVSSYAPPSSSLTGAFRSLSETDLKRANAALSQATREGKQFRIRQDIPRLSFDASFHDPNEAVATNSGGHPTPILESDDAFGIPTDIPDVPGDTAPDDDVDQDSALVEQVSLLVHDKTINLTVLA
ncbi:hypothetical protein C8J56DRAFT_1118398 [Mycena floridula]|nr:hypothetical protein C8J56DRAFT_1118398 [Mycena floridula]